MKIEIYKDEKGETKKILESFYSYMEGQSRQEKKPSFFISTSGGKDSGFEIHFSTEDISEIDNFIKNLEEIRENLLNYKKKKNN